MTAEAEEVVAHAEAGDGQEVAPNGDYAALGFGARRECGLGYSRPRYEGAQGDTVESAVGTSSSPSTVSKMTTCISCDTAHPLPVQDHHDDGPLTTSTSHLMKSHGIGARRFAAM